MNNFIIYSLEIAISIALFYTAYWIFLKNETFFKLNRFYLMAAVMVSLLTPLLNINIGQDSFIKNLVLPIDQYEQSIIGHRHLKNKMVEGIANSKGQVVPFKDKASFIDAGKEETTALNSGEAASANNTINWLTIVLVIYFTGAALFLIRFTANFVWIFSYVLKNKAQTIFGMKVIKIEKNISPFSFLNFIFISNKDYPETELTKIIFHEKVHIQQKHSIDLILLELVLAAQWFNPFVWFHKRALKITHEYLADQGTLNSGVDLPEYHYSLLNQALSENNFEIASNYNLTIKKRIKMMMKKRSPKLAAIKLAVALPILVFLFSAFAFNATSSLKEVENIVVANGDTTIKEVSVTVEYLKLLQGEYVSANVQYKPRTIVFTELLGTLFGYDDGYTYKIIPVGGEKFINPDDHASLIFNSKDKTAITLLLFEKVNLNRKYPVGKGQVQNRSMAFTLANVMLKDGIADALSYYKVAKDSGNYFITEGELNFAGYELLQAGKAKEAAAILKLNIELYPNSFNVYDSYAEALLAIGDKAQAIENYKRSVQLNPGSKNGLKMLKEFGINPDDVVKLVKVPVEELKPLEGVYISTTEPTGPSEMMKIVIKLENGILTGEDNGYKYKLIPMGNGKFINPDDGASLVFDATDKNAITLLIFGNAHLRKVKITKEPNLNIKEYAGIYLPSKQDSLIIKEMVVIQENNKLFRFIAAEPEGPNKKVELKLVTENIFIYTDNSGKSVEFIVDDKKQVTSCILRRGDGIYDLSKKK